VSQTEITITALDGIPQVRPRDDLAGLLIAALLERPPRSRDILVVTSKIVSKAEGRYLDLASVEPSARALELARVTNKDPRIVEAILSETTEVIRAKPNVLIVATRHGLVMANAGIDQSNLGAEDHGRRVLLLPQAPDDSARALKERLDKHFGVEIGVIVRQRRPALGTVGIAIGAPACRRCGTAAARRTPGGRPR
jgi:coenzyme F420-0:L-glutamate ligase/coenzyme F420-1:gamma-L-glutamate ligase